VPISFLFEHQLKASDDTQSVRGCLFRPYRIAVQGLKRGLLVSRDCSFRLRVCSHSSPKKSISGSLELSG
jgi:hypothetical protein